MSEEADRLIEKAQIKLRSLEADVVRTKEFINQIREFEGLPPLFSEVSAPAQTAASVVRSDQFYGRPLATVVREILEMRKASNQGPASVSEIYGRLVEGGYRFDVASPENAKRSLRISLTKNPLFHRVPNGDYGLTEWYPAARQNRRARFPEEQRLLDEPMMLSERTSGKTAMPDGPSKTPILDGQ